MSTTSLTTRELREYASELVGSLLAGTLPTPSDDGCPICTLQMGVLSEPLEAMHVKEHVRRKQLVPSLLWRAVVGSTDWSDVLLLLQAWRGRSLGILLRRRESIEALVVRYLAGITGVKLEKDVAA